MKRYYEKILFFLYSLNMRHNEALQDTSSSTYNKYISNMSSKAYIQFLFFLSQVFCFSPTLNYRRSEILNNMLDPILHT